MTLATECALVAVSSLKNDLVDYKTFARQAGGHASLTASRGRYAAPAA